MFLQPTLTTPPSGAEVSGPGLTTNLSLPLEVEREHYNSIYSCVAADPVSNQTITVNITTPCENGDPGDEE
ncbi:unnamed protein product, partial [Coregonus sp. 'balchen']